MSKRPVGPKAGERRPTYAENLLAELDAIAESYTDVLAASSIKYVNPNTRDSPVFIVGAQEWGWCESDDALESARMALLRRLRDWVPRFRLLFQHPIPTVTQRLDDNIGLLEAWLVRSNSWGQDPIIPSTIEEAQRKIASAIEGLRRLVDLLPTDDYPTRLVLDTNALIDNPDVTVYAVAIGSKYMVHLLPIVLREIDEQKRAGRHQDIREAAKRAERRLKGIRNNGDIREGICVAGSVFAKFEYTEPVGADLPEWLDLSVPDDRLVASSLLLQSQHPGSALYVGTSDINLQTKLAAVGLPFVEPPGSA